MTIDFHGDVPPDILIEREVDRAIEAGCPMPRWGWPIPGPYQGATGHERIAGWQKLRIADQRGLLSLGDACGLCGSPDAPQRHTEIYFRALTSKPICRSCHFHIHRRFKRPDEWRLRIRQSPMAETWVRQLRTTELTRDDAMAIAVQRDVFAALTNPRRGTGA